MKTRVCLKYSVNDCNLLVAKYVASRHGFANRSNREMEPKYLTKSHVQLNPNISRTKKVIKRYCKKL